MRIRVNLPKVEPNVYVQPGACPYGCGGQYFKPHGVQDKAKPLRDPHYTEVQCQRYTCVRCGRSFRVYPRGVSAGPQSERLKGRRLVWERPADGEAQLEGLYGRYTGAPAPAPGERHSVWSRTWMLITRLWERWRKFTLDQQRDDPDGTNNACERLIGWWIKERYRTMRGYKREASIKNAVTLTARMGVRSGRYAMSEFFS